MLGCCSQRPTASRSASAYVEIRRRPENGFRFANDAVYLHHLSVRPAEQRRGIGRALMVAVRALAAAEGIAHVELDVWTFNDRARRFFAQQGFVTYNERMWSRGTTGDGGGDLTNCS